MNTDDNSANQVWTQKTVDEFIAKLEPNTVVQFPSYTKFDKCTKFPDNVVFGSNCSFGSSCEFGNNCKFAIATSFDSFTRFGQECSFETRCTFKHDNVFAANCKFKGHMTFGTGNLFAKQCLFYIGNHKFGSNSKFGAKCKFSSYTTFGPGSRFGTRCILSYGSTIAESSVFDDYCKINCAAIADHCVFGQRCKFETTGSFGAHLKFGRECTFEKKYKVKPHAPYPFISIAGLGSNQRTTYFFDTVKGVIVRCGCFIGTLEEFITKVTEVYGPNGSDDNMHRHLYYQQYTGAASYVKSIFELPSVKPKGKKSKARETVVVEEITNET